MKNNRTPEIRFLGFINNWEPRKLDKILKERKVKQKISKEVPLLAFAAGQGVIDRSERKTNNRDFLTKDSTKKTYLLTKYDDIVYNPSNLKYGAIDRNKHGQGVISPIYVTFETDEIPSFIELIVKSESFKQRALQYEEGTVTKRQSVKPENLLCLNVVLPNSKDEQIKIGNLFKQLDETIALHQQELDIIKQTKQGFLQKMFPKEENSVPEVRFPGFTGDWEQRKLGQVANITMGQSPNGENYTENPDDHILVQGNADIKNGWVAPRVWTTQVTKSADKGDIILSVRAPVGDVGKTQYDVVLGRGVAGIKGNEFIFQSLSKMKSNGFWTKYSTGSTFESINSNDLKEAIISVPGEVEQTKIGNFFKQLDDTIALHQRELDALKETKKAFLQKMFV
ncbi:type I restriction endonuclease subunit S [Bacillus thuringiensis]|uniref:restriction endonuclease subunit S n=1 Tax=Bacillus cereus group TaxID=86661 RepID=UPI000BFBC8A2|nr:MULTISPECIES: restriction endonuclease subunit S [Bacillus cereus group]MCU5685383.1 restriction endonuclease subunit S [Bacillus wiedmannii]PGT39229.1 type I restriction endonuclease subunit S [Bacillus thuringiensis]